VEETGVPSENYGPVASHWQTLLVEETGVPSENYGPVASHW
jgi:hypothetical protein